MTPPVAASQMAPSTDSPLIKEEHRFQMPEVSYADPEVKEMFRRINFPYPFGDQVVKFDGVE